jgi:hypothetical protein
MYNIIRESNSCWGEHLTKISPNAITLKNLPEFRSLIPEDPPEDPLYGIEMDYSNVEYGLTLATYIFNGVFCTVYFDEKVGDYIPKHIDLILKGITKDIIDKNEGLSKGESNIRSSIFEEIGDNDNWMEDANIWGRLSGCVLKQESIIRQIYIKSRDYRECQNLNLFLYLIHHESNHCASALLTWRRGACSLNAWAEIWIDFCTIIEVNDFFVLNESEYDVPASLKLYESKMKHIILAEYIINRAQSYGKSLDEVFEAIWRYCFDKHIEEEEARKIFGDALNISKKHIEKLERKTKVDEVITYCNFSNIPSFKFTGTKNFVD